MRILVLCDDRWHPADVPRAGLAPIENSGYELDWIEDAGDWSSEKMAGYPAVILTKSNHISSSNHNPWMTGAVQAAFRDYVRMGGVLLAVHSGTAGYAETPILRSLLGGVFSHHPDQCPVTIQPLKGHPLAANIEPFSRKDEHYHMLLDDREADVFLKTISDHGEQPGGWTRKEGAGRVAVLTPGHNLEVWLHPAFQTLLTNILGSFSS